MSRSPDGPPRPAALHGASTGWRPLAVLFTGRPALLGPPRRASGSRCCSLDDSRHRAGRRASSRTARTECLDRWRGGAHTESWIGEPAEGPRRAGRRAARTRLVRSSGITSPSRHHSSSSSSPSIRPIDTAEPASAMAYRQASRPANPQAIPASTASNGSHSCRRSAVGRCQPIPRRICGSSAPPANRILQKRDRHAVGGRASHQHYAQGALASGCSTPNLGQARTPELWRRISAASIRSGGSA
jgi:hypothetical protein